MSDRQYRQRGYQDEPKKDREPRSEKPAQEPRAPGRSLQDAAGPRTPNLMAAHEVFKCARCGNPLHQPVEASARCSRCGVAVHSCVNCVSFDTGSRFECSEPALTTRVSPKDELNLCAYFNARTTVERQTGTVAPTSARKAFDDLFK